ncbi:MFS transporter [Ramlibacter sp. AW1]|uniref:MFS transporter n=1 Tax=Ramlibacter aurantiacus TaxID=2801330 RepID=A0A936ZHE5_9BURK|nr:MFS transporter [Ramlibacter aurantiacus]MBL0421479.1 MFS transporter [Ramlibacter aurantiacus]
MTASARSLRALPIVVACPIFLQNIDTTAMATALPRMAESLQVQVLDLNLAITAYLLSLALFLPASAWLADRVGARRLFCAAVLVFTAASALCGLAQSLGELVTYRLLQGIGGSMMVPVGRTILLRSVPADQLVRAMVWFTIPGVIGRLAGPLLGGAIVTFSSWRWIFLVNIPFGVLGAALAWWLVEPDPPQHAPGTRFDGGGGVLLALALLGLLGGLQMLGKGLLPGWAIGLAMAVGAVALWAYFQRRLPEQERILDFAVLRFPTFRVSIIGGFPLRMAIGAAPFLLPLMLQVGFGLSPLHAGLVVVSTAVGALSTRVVVARVIRRLGFRTVMVGSAALAGLFYLGYGLFTPQTPTWLMAGVLVLGGLCSSLTMVSLSTLGFSDIPANRTGHATAISSMAQQLSTAIGVVMGAALVSLFAFVHRGSTDRITAEDFLPSFVAVALLAWMSAWAFRSLGPEAGDELRGRPKR